MNSYTPPPRPGAVRIKLPFSEACVHMKVAGREMWVEPLSHRMAQLVNDDGSNFSFPITRGEAGLREHYPHHGQVRAMYEGEWVNLVYGPDRHNFWTVRYPSGEERRLHGTEFDDHPDNPPATLDALMFHVRVFDQQAEVISDQAGDGPHFGHLTLSLTDDDEVVEGVLRIAPGSYEASDTPAPGTRLVNIPWLIERDGTLTHSSNASLVWEPLSEEAKAATLRLLFPETAS